MDALVNSLMEELNCETVFTIPIEQTHFISAESS